MKRCTGPCGEDKALVEFSVDRQKRDGRASRCKACEKERVLAYGRSHAEENRQRVARWKRENPGRLRAYYDEHRGEILARVGRWRMDNLEHVKARSKVNYRSKQQVKLEASRQYSRDVRARVFAHYGSSCVCCGSTECLTIDHVNGDGREHRLMLPKGVLAVYRWLIKNNFPKGFQTLCRSCNSSKGRGRRCQLKHSREAA